MREPERRYRIISRSHNLPLRMRGTFTYGEAYDLVCDWNYGHDVTEMAMIEVVEK